LDLWKATKTGSLSVSELIRPAPCRATVFVEWIEYLEKEDIKITMDGKGRANKQLNVIL
jgi:hypothetical protein